MVTRFLKTLVTKNFWTWDKICIYAYFGGYEKMSYTVLRRCFKTPCICIRLSYCDMWQRGIRRHQRCHLRRCWSAGQHIKFDSRPRQNSRSWLIKHDNQKQMNSGPGINQNGHVGLHTDCQKPHSIGYAPKNPRNNRELEVVDNEGFFCYL